MRTFVISVITLVSVISFSTFNLYKTKTVTSQMLDALSVVEQEASEDAYNQYYEVWEKYSFFFDTTLPRHKSELMIEGMAIIKAAISEHDSSAFMHGITITREAINSIADSSTLNLKNIL